MNFKPNRVWDMIPFQSELIEERRENVVTWDFKTTFGRWRVERRDSAYSGYWLVVYSEILGDIPLVRYSLGHEWAPNRQEVANILHETIAHLSDRLDGAGIEMSCDIAEILFLGLRFIAANGTVSDAEKEILRIRLGNEAERRLSRMPIPSGDALPKPHVLSKSEARSALSAIRRSNDEAAVIAARNLMLTIESGKPLEE